MKNLAIKLLAFQKEVGVIVKESENPFYHSKFADINSYLEVVKPLLNNLGLVILQPLTNLPAQVMSDGLFKNPVPALETQIIDTNSGETITSLTVLPENSDPQKMGAIITYFRRFAIQSLLCLQATDDDGESAVTHTTPKASVIANKQATAHSSEPSPDDMNEIDRAFGVQSVDEVPFENNTCKDCGAEKVPGKNGKPYCVQCYKKWAAVNKPRK